MLEVASPGHTLRSRKPTTPTCTMGAMPRFGSYPRSVVRTISLDTLIRWPLPVRMGVWIAGKLL